jgi:hypothetical protein
MESPSLVVAFAEVAAEPAAVVGASHVVVVEPVKQRPARASGGGLQDVTNLGASNQKRTSTGADNLVDGLCTQMAALNSGALAASVTTEQ